MGYPHPRRIALVEAEHLVNPAFPDGEHWVPLTKDGQIDSRYLAEPDGAQPPMTRFRMSAKAVEGRRHCFLQPWCEDCDRYAHPSEGREWCEAPDWPSPCGELRDSGKECMATAILYVEEPAGEDVSRT